MCFWKEPQQVSESVAFAEYVWNMFDMCHKFLKIKTEEWDLKILQFDYWNHLALGSGETCFLEVSANIKTEEWDLTILLFRYWNGSVLGSLQMFFLEVEAYASLKRVTAGLWEDCFWLKKLLFFNKRKEEWELKVLLFNYGNSLALGSVKIFFLEVGAYMSLKRATVILWEAPFY